MLLKLKSVSIGRFIIGGNGAAKGPVAFNAQDKAVHLVVPAAQNAASVADAAVFDVGVGRCRASNRRYKCRQRCHRRQPPRRRRRRRGRTNQRLPGRRSSIGGGTSRSAANADADGSKAAISKCKTQEEFVHVVTQPNCYAIVRVEHEVLRLIRGYRKIKTGLKMQQFLWQT